MFVVNREGYRQEVSDNRRRRFRDHEILAYRDLLMLRRSLDGMSQAEIAILFGCTQPLVSKRIGRIPVYIKNAMKEAIENGEAEDSSIDTLVGVLRKYYQERK